MAVPHGMRFEIPFDVLFPHKVRNRPMRPRIDEPTGRRLYRATVADPAAEKERDKSIAADVQPEAVGNLPFRPVVLEGLTVQPHAETSGQAKWITRVVQAPGRGSAKPNEAGKSVA